MTERPNYFQHKSAVRHLRTALERLTVKKGSHLQSQATWPKNLIRRACRSINRATAGSAIQQLLANLTYRESRRASTKRKRIYTKKSFKLRFVAQMRKIQPLWEQPTLGYSRQLRIALRISMAGSSKLTSQTTRRIWPLSKQHQSSRSRLITDQKGGKSTSVKTILNATPAWWASRAMLGQSRKNHSVRNSWATTC